MHESLQSSKRIRTPRQTETVTIVDDFDMIHTALIPYGYCEIADLTARSHEKTSVHPIGEEKGFSVLRTAIAMEPTA